MAPLLARFGQRVDALPDAPGDAVPVDALDPGGDPKRRRSVDRLRYVSSVDEHLGRDAPTVQAGAAKLVLLDNGNRPASVVRARDRIPGACPNNNQVELLHHTPPALHCKEAQEPPALAIAAPLALLRQQSGLIYRAKRRLGACQTPRHCRTAHTLQRCQLTYADPLAHMHVQEGVRLAIPPRQLLQAGTHDGEGLFYQVLGLRGLWGITVDSLPQVLLEVLTRAL